MPERDVIRNAGKQDENLGVATGVPTGTALHFVGRPCQTPSRNSPSFPSCTWERPDLRSFASQSIAANHNRCRMLSFSTPCAFATALRIAFNVPILNTE